MSLRWRLVISLVAIAAAVAVVGIVALEVSDRLQARVGHLSRRSGVTLPSNPEGQTFEIEGTWHAGGFVASDIDLLPGSRRPKLRGTLEAVDAAGGSVRMFGLTIYALATTEFSGPPLPNLVAGQRAEISCRVDSTGRWTARNIRTKDIKSNDKIKGTTTHYIGDGTWPDTLAIHDLVVLVGQQKSSESERTLLHRIGVAAQLGVSLRQVLVSSQQLVDEGDAGQQEAIIAELGSAANAFGHSVDELSSSVPIGSDEQARWLNEMASGSVVLQTAVDEFVALSRTGTRPPGDYLQPILVPLVRNRLLPLVDAYRLDAEEALADEVSQLVADTALMKKVILITTVVAVILTLAMGFGLWRAVSGPLVALSAAARRIGGGGLDTRVEEPSTGELGEVARSFNIMAAELQASTVSIEKLNVLKDELHQSLADRELLLKEIHHRVKNNLQIVSSLMDLQSGHVTDPESLELFKESRARIRSMALIHEQLYRSTDLGQIDFKTYVELLVDGLVRSSGCGGRIDFHLNLQPVHLDIDRAVPCGLIINELITNSVRHAFSDSEQGEITVGFASRGDDFELSITDNGRGMGENWATNGGSLGLELVTSLASQLRGELNVVSDNGARITLRFPAAPSVREATS